MLLLQYHSITRRLVMSTKTLSKKLAAIEPGTLFVGVDLALDCNTAVVLLEHVGLSVRGLARKFQVAKGWLAP